MSLTAVQHAAAGPFTRREVIAAIGATALAAPAGAGGTAGKTRTAALARGFNLPDLVPDTRPRPVEGDILRTLYGRGMSHVRLPVHAEHVLPRFAGPATIAAAVDDLERALDLLLGTGFTVTVDMHPGAALAALYRTDPEAGLAALLDGWKALAPKLGRFPPSRVLAELLNEPPTSDEVWRRHAAVLVEALRQSLPSTTLVTGPAPYQRVEALAAWPKLADQNVVYAFHYYDPMAFTHQGASWMPDSPYARIAGVPFPARLGDPRIGQVLTTLDRAGDRAFAEEFRRSLATPWDRVRIAAQFAPLAAWSRANGVPVVLNEFGVLRFTAPPQDRIRWISAVRHTAEANGFGWALWDYDGGFGLVENGRPDPGTLQALLGP